MPLDVGGDWTFTVRVEFTGGEWAELDVSITVEGATEARRGRSLGQVCGNRDAGPCAAPIGAIFQLQGTPVSLGDLS